MISLLFENSFSMKGNVMSIFTMGSAEGVPPGAYTGIFRGYEHVDATADMGPGVRWRWEVSGGAHAGRIVNRITGLKPNPKNACGKILAGLAGKALSEGESVDIDSYIGKLYTIMIVAGPSGGTRVEAVAPAMA